MVFETGDVVAVDDGGEHNVDLVMVFAVFGVGVLNDTSLCWCSGDCRV